MHSVSETGVNKWIANTRTPLCRSSSFIFKSLDALPEAARAYIARLEDLVGAPIDIISTGPDREETIVLRHPFGQ